MGIYVFLSSSGVIVVSAEVDDAVLQCGSGQVIVFPRVLGVRLPASN